MVTAVAASIVDPMTGFLEPREDAYEHMLMTDEATFDSTLDFCISGRDI